MNRGDARIFFTIVSTAFITAFLMIVLSRLVGTTDPRVDELNRRLHALEQRAATLEAGAATPVPAEAPLPAPVVAPDPDPCDEVACVLGNYEAACCARFDKRRHRDDSILDQLDRQLIADGIQVVRSHVHACADRTTARGTVKVGVRVAPDGTPTSVTVKETPDAALGRCVAEAVSRARFAQTRDGGAFTYPFRF